MGKILTFIIIGAAVLLGIAGIMFFMNKDKAPETGDEDATTEETADAEESQEMDNTEETNTDQNTDGNTSKKFSTLKAAVDLGLPFKCTYTMAGVTTEGYVKGKQFKGVMVTADGKKGQVIVKNECMWSWEDGSPEGLTMCFEPTETQKSIWDDQTAFEGVEYSCKPAIITDDAFNPPSDVNFVDMSQLLNSIPQEGQ